MYDSKTDLSSHDTGHTKGGGELENELPAGDMWSFDRSTIRNLKGI